MAGSDDGRRSLWPPKWHYLPLCTSAKDWPDDEAALLTAKPDRLQTTSDEQAGKTLFPRMMLSRRDFKSWAGQKHGIRHRPGRQEAGGGRSSGKAGLGGGPAILGHGWSFSGRFSGGCFGSGSLPAA